MSAELSDGLLAKLAGWEAVKQARSLVALDRVLSSDWKPPLLRGVVLEGSASYRAGMVIHSASDAENLCTCRDSRQRGIICAHAVAVGLHFLKSQTPAVEPSKVPPPGKSPITINQPAAAKSNAKRLLRAEPGQTGEHLELAVVLPPNFTEALTRGKVMLYVEGKWDRGRGPLNALPRDVAMQLDTQDGLLLDALEALNDGETPGMLMLNARQFTQLLPKLAGHPRVTLGKSQAVTVRTEPLRLALRAGLGPTGEITLSLRDPADLPRSWVRLSTEREGSSINPSVWIFTGQEFRALALPAGLEGLLQEPVRILRPQVPLFLNLQWRELTSQCDVEADFSMDMFVLEPATPSFRLHLAGGIAMLQARLECFYGEKPVSAIAGEVPWLPDPDSPTRYRTRNFAAEEAAAARLSRSGFGPPDPLGLRHLKGENQVLTFFASEYPRLEKEWQVTLEERLERSTQKNIERIEPSFRITSSGEQWFDLTVDFGTRGGEKFSSADIQRLLRSGQSHTRLKNGKFALLDTGAVEELNEVLLDCAPQQQAGGYRIANAQAGFLDATLHQQTAWRVDAAPTWTQRAARQRGEVKLDPPALGSLETILRPYQKTGVAWLHFLRTHGFNGILADEMGLGKTVQVLALLAASRAENASASPSLVVCPTSLVFNWAAEAAKFTPELKVLTVEGTGRRELFPRISQHDLVITSYALLRRDTDHYRGLEFDTVILDEAQHIKNRETQNAQAVKAIRSQHRLVLTGTPLENSVLDLWSIFDFLMSGYLGAAADFRERYEVPIAREKSAEAQARLARRLRPFLFRRLKREVAADLPEKIEQVSYCELSEDQRGLYQQVLEASRREIVGAVEANGLARSRMVILTALLRLRQICCDPRLLKLEAATESASAADAKTGTSSARAAVASGKVDLFGELLEEVLDGGHRVLVFSQFTSMLGLLREELSKLQIEYCYLDGSTQDRARVVEKFQRDQAIPVFLISLKAGGVGLNLTGADTVIHFDPWWNPAVEAQATDRAHRIGQKRVVTSYKLITRGTVEEKILTLQSRKKALVEGLLGGEEQLAGALDWNEIQDLLAG
jgi:superfamily II DNA or RNA helicase